MEMTEGKIQLGEIYREHGVRGFCKVHIYSQIDTNLKVGHIYELHSVDGQILKSKLSEVSSSGRYFLLKFEAFKNPEELKNWRKAQIYLSAAQLERDDDELYDFEWKGFSVKSGSDVIGVVQAVTYTPLRQLVVISPKQNEILIPLRKEWILKLDRLNKSVVFELPEGLMELES